MPQFDGGRAFHENPRIGCLKQGETGDWGMIVIGSTGLSLWFPELFTHVIPGCPYVQAMTNCPIVA